MDPFDEHLEEYLEGDDEQVDVDSIDEQTDGGSMDVDHEEEDNNKENAEDKKKTHKRTRGIVRLTKIIADKIKGIKRHLRFNSRGQSIGTPNRELQCYLGMQAKSMVPIDIDNWREVPKSILDSLWKDVNLAFHLDENMRNNIIGSVGNKWRQFKCNLNKKFIVPYLNDPSLLEAKPRGLDKPPPSYHIEETHWKEFVKRRTSKEFQDFRKLQQERRNHLK
ncbi:uncharacterized protein LOC133782573 [Humulus lupulus]|uniref:uncharacterized protein LOC133782573 n=1 Tax=Humulus lupulus TaxID=3486 RepID=UPI002B4155EE|nr:uncharacterized protein LOC133782573 [Humulus lupulus]